MSNPAVPRSAPKPASEPAAAAPGPVRSPQALEPLALQDGDCYWEGERMVLTAAYHLRRGYCCGSGCRHCPYPKAGA